MLGMVLSVHSLMAYRVIKCSVQMSLKHQMVWDGQASTTALTNQFHRSGHLLKLMLYRLMLW